MNQFAAMFSLLQSSFLFLVLLSLQAVAHLNDLIVSQPRSAYLLPRLEVSNITFPSLNGSSLNASATAIANAEALIAEVIAQQSEYNLYRVANPRRNTYQSRHSAPTFQRFTASDIPPQPLLNGTILAAAALIAERDAALQQANSTLTNAPRHSKSKRTTTNYWLSQLSGNGMAPMGGNTGYQIYRDVSQYGAKGDGVTDDTNAINNAISAYNCDEGCESSSVLGALIYFPPGTYLISSPINAVYYSQLVGDAINPPTIKTSANFVGLGAIQTDVYIPGGNSAEWYVEQSNFFRQVRNFIIDITGTTTASVAGLHWQVAQATSLINVVIKASTASGSGNTQMGMFTENGSGGFMSNVQITGGQYGIYGGNQQYTVRDFTISGQTTACICLIWDWGWTWQGLDLSNAPVGISLINPQAPSGQQAGSTYVMDSLFNNVQTGIHAEFNKTIIDSSIITLDNVYTEGVNTVVSYADGTALNIPSGNIDFIVIGDVVDEGSYYGSYGVEVPTRPAPLVSGAQYAQTSYLTVERPQYSNIAVSSIISVKAQGAKGDGKTDDTAAIQSAFNMATSTNLIYFPAGSYIVTNTLKTGDNIRMTGEVWSQLVASGSYFANEGNPQPMLQVGTPGDVGTVEISDMLFTSIGSLPGLVMVQWNVAAASPGSVGIWDAHFRVGGADGTQLQVAQCPNTKPIQSGCIAANTMLHITPTGNGYFENMWLWVADHDIDDANDTQITVAAARGLLLDSSPGPNWLWGTAAEHAMLYQYNFVNTTNTVAGMIQTESPYFQYTSGTQSPGVWAYDIGAFNGDPDFEDGTCNGTSLACSMSWAVMFADNTNLTIAGAGLYSWFDNYVESCVDTQNCQQRLVYDNGFNGGLRLWNLITIGSIEMVSSPQLGVAVLAKANTQSEGHPYWSALAGYLDSSAPEILNCDWNDTSPACFTSSVCDLTVQYPTLDALESAASTVPGPCIDYYALDTLNTMLNSSLNKYTSVDSGYDAVFGDYQQYIKDIIPELLTDFMTPSSPNKPAGGAGNAFFSCTLSGYGGPTVTQQCPIPWQTYQNDLKGFTYAYTLSNSSGFYATLESTYNINQTWVTFGSTGGKKTTCSPRGDQCLTTDFLYTGVPIAASNIDVPNPKSVITAALPTLATLQDNMLASLINLDLGTYNGSSDDLLQAYSFPVFMIDQAINSMAMAKKIGKQVAREKKIALILEILGGVFAFLPFLDDIAPALGALDGIFTGVAEVGNVAITIEQIVSDPSSAPMAILGLVSGVGGRDEGFFASLAGKRRVLAETDISDLGDTFKADNDGFEAAIKEKCHI